MSSSNTWTFPDIDFVDVDAQAIADEKIAQLEDAIGRTLGQADPLRIMFLWYIADICQERSYANVLAKRNLPRYAMQETDGKYLDSLAEIFYQITRKQSEGATTTLKFTISEAQDEDTVIPEGTEATDSAGTVYFSTDEELTIPAGSLTGTVEATCLTEGTEGNAYPIGKINVLVDDVPYVTEVTNTRMTSGGADEETNEELYNRGRESYESPSTAGTVGGFTQFVLEYNSEVMDVEVYNVEGGVIGITMLMDGGIPTDEEVADMQEYISGDEIRPIGTKVIVSAPEAVEFEVEAVYYGAERPEPGGTALAELMQGAAEEYLKWQQSRLGRTIDPGELSHLMYEAGAGRVTIVKPTVQELTAKQCAVLKGEIKLSYGGDS